MAHISHLDIDSANDLTDVALSRPRSKWARIVGHGVREHQMRIPQEVCELILDAMYDDEGYEQYTLSCQALRSCALACRAWRSRSQFWLFHAVKVTDLRTLRKLAHLLVERPHFRAFVQKLYLIGPLHQSRSVATALATTVRSLLLPNLRTVWLVHVPGGGPSADRLPYLPIHPRFPLSFRAFSTVHDLALTNVGFPSFLDFAFVLQSVPGLRTLCCLEVKWSSANTPASLPFHRTKAVFLPRLEELSVRTMDPRGLRKLICATRRSLVRLDIDSASLNDLAGLSKMRGTLLAKLTVKFIPLSTQTFKMKLTDSPLEQSAVLSVLKDCLHAWTPGGPFQRSLRLEPKLPLYSHGTRQTFVQLMRVIGRAIEDTMCRDAGLNSMASESEAPDGNLEPGCATVVVVIRDRAEMGGWWDDALGGCFPTLYSLKRMRVDCRDSGNISRWEPAIRYKYKVVPRSPYTIRARRNRFMPQHGGVRIIYSEYEPVVQVAATRTRSATQRNLGRECSEHECLPFDIIHILLDFTTIYDLVSLCSTCKTLRNHIKNDSIWKRVSAPHGIRDFTRFGGASPYTVYTTLLHPYAPILGLWANDHPFTGKVMEFRLFPGDGDEQGGLVGEVWSFPSPDTAASLDEPASPTYARAVKVSFEDQPLPGPHEQDDRKTAANSPPDRPLRPNVFCDGGTPAGTGTGPTSRHLTSLTVRAPTRARQHIQFYRQPIDLPDFPLNLRCHDEGPRFPRLPGEPQQDEDVDQSAIVSIYPAARLPVVWVSPSVTVPPALTLRCSGACPCAVLHTPPIPFPSLDTRPPRYYPLENTVLPGMDPRAGDWSLASLQGIWYGSYGSNGTEVLYLFYLEEHGGQIAACKITGDVHVPRGWITWVLSDMDQESDMAQAAREFWLLATHGDPPDPPPRMLSGRGVVAGRGFKDLRAVVLLAGIMGPDEIQILWTHAFRKYRRYKGRGEVPAEIVATDLEEA
ncbi:hypothetical protein C8Q80DRAFT_1122370 [Daedaleopsis nitida]|nr:hypothetical protein C8Q80DRAFT_1122370 [Daedaleopsis nitida]